MTTEKDVERILILHASQCGSTLFKNEVGAAWRGKMSKAESRLPNRLVLTECRQIKYGLCNGSSDLIGWTPITITPDMIGKKIAVFTAIEVKKKTNADHTARQTVKSFSLTLLGATEGMLVWPIAKKIWRI